MGKVKETGEVVTRLRADVSPEFKAYVADTCRLQAATLTNSQRHAEAAAKAEADRIAEEARRAEEARKATERETAARAADREHRGAVMGAAKEAIMEAAKVSEKAAKDIVLAIAAGSIPAVSIGF